MPPWLNRIIAMAGAGLRQMLTERDNATLDIKRIGGGVALVFVIGCKAYDLVWRKGDLNFAETCQSLAVLLGALGATIAINRNTENGG